ncbi:DUF3298 domain-containing protein [Stutzerimonas nosocomialis]|uniref:RsiV family protein n=1 Tax=Stutzerimonas nosocomialis TaxID=1056496 RepID=UPI00110967E7|nr:RsiV family protein [Stutzerimonas nosocomialis]TLX55249.1 DUF3298 domain-containing protein [Stutzerimonas nosocomialis]TLX58055.1 DUF3298 domain-containing protein [Stutzerimonas nosocomialis]
MTSPFTCRALALSGLVLLLGACQSQAPDTRQPQVQVRQVLSEQRPQGCTADNCPLVNVDTLQFADEPALNQLIDARLRAMTRSRPDDQIPPTLDAYRQRFLQEAAPGWASYLQAKVREQHGSILVIELSSYLFEGGAHGMPGRGFINYDLEQDRELVLSDLLEPGASTDFWRHAEKAHWRWLEENEHARDADFLEHWPFQPTPHVALLNDRILLKYDVYSIAPYSSGHPELEIPLADLKGILRPEYLH